MPLSEDQVRAVRVLDWLLDSQRNRQTGRSYAIAVALIRQALRYPEQWIHYIDHVPSLPRRERDRVCRSLVDYIINEDPFLRFLTFRVEQKRFRLVEVPTETIVTSATVPWPLHAWLPDERLMAETAERVLTVENDSLRRVLAQEESLDELLRQVEFAEAEEPVDSPSLWERLTAEGDAFDVAGLEDGSDGHEDPT